MAIFPREKIFVIGAGLVGSLLAIYLKRRGYDVVVFDKSPDILENECSSGKSSINLTLCERGFRALDDVGVGDLIRRFAIPAYGRLMHDVHGCLTFQSYGNNNQALYSILRHDLNRILLQFARQKYHVEFHFCEKCLDIDLLNTTITFKNLQTGTISHRRADRIFGADGAFSAVRAGMQKTECFNYSQQYLDYGYRELTIPANGTDWLGQRNALHVWPRGSYMLMGFPNIDNSFTITLHLPFKGPISFEAISSKAALLHLFETSFPDVLPRILPLTDDYFVHSTNSMVTIRCSPWHVQDRIMLIGDAAHAIVPYYGQGANAGFEDCIILDQCIETYNGRWNDIFCGFEALRRPNTDAIADLALRNFIELRDLVGNRRFLLRKRIEQFLHRKYPDRYSSLYSMIAFSSMPYIEALRLDREQSMFVDQIMDSEILEGCNDLEIDILIDGLMEHTLACRR